MRVPGRLKPQTGGYGTALLLLSVPVACSGIILVLTEIALRLGWGAAPSSVWAAGDLRNVPTGDFWKACLVAIDGATALWLSWWFHQQKNTYTPISFTGGWGSRALAAVGWVLAKSLFLAIMAAVALFLVVPVAIGLCGVGLLLKSGEPTFLQRLLSDGAVLLGVSTAVVGLTAFSRVLWFWSALRHVDLLPSTRGPLPPEGLVEIRGIALPLDPGAPPKPLLGSAPPNWDDVGSGPFIVEVEGGRVRIEPPDGFGVYGGQAILPAGEGHGQPVLMPGDPVVALGGLERRPEGPPVLRPYAPLRGALLGPGRKGFLSVPDVFLIAHGDEKTARRRLTGVHVRWLAFAVFLTGGGLVVALLGLAARLNPRWMDVLASAGGFR